MRVLKKERLYRCTFHGEFSKARTWYGPVTCPNCDQGLPPSEKPEIIRYALDQERDTAQETHSLPADGDLQIDVQPKIIIATNGYWVSAWAFVRKEWSDTHAGQHP